MKTIAASLFAFAVLMFPVSVPAATLAEVDAWKAEFPAATPTDSAKLHQMIASYQQSVKQVTPTARKIIMLLRDKLSRDLASVNNVLHPPKPNPKITPAMRADAEEAGKWLNGKFAPFLAKSPL